MGRRLSGHPGEANRDVAAKMILSGDRAGSEDVARFRLEAEAVARLQHPNIVAVYEVGEHAGLPFFSMEYCSGGSLATLVSQRALSPHDACGLLLKIARGAAAAHAAGIVHRDLKPQNVLLAAGRHAEDLRLRARQAAQLDPTGVSGRVDADGCGSRHAGLQRPEQALGDSKHVEARIRTSTLWPRCSRRLLVGRPPFVGPARWTRCSRW